MPRQPKNKPKFNPSLIYKNHHPFFERIFYRHISHQLTPLAAKIGLLPNTVTYLGFLIGLGGIVLIAFGDYWLRVLGGGILIFSFVIDCVDGELARGLKIQNNFGAFLDTTLDSLKESLIFFALAWNYHLQTHWKDIFLFAVAVLFLQRMFGRTLAWYRLLFHRDIEWIKKDAVRHFPILFKLISYFFAESYRSGTIWIVIFIGIIADQIIATFIYFIVVMSALLFFLIIKAYRFQKKGT